MFIIEQNKTEEFPKWQLPKFAISQAATSLAFSSLQSALAAAFGRLVHPSRRTWPQLQPPAPQKAQPDLREVATWETVTWEVALGKMPLGKYLTSFLRPANF